MPAVSQQASAAFRASSPNPDLEAADKLVDKIRDWSLEAISVASGYEQIIIAAGYAGFFAVWTQTAEHLPRDAVLWSGGLIGISLVAFVGFHLLSISVRSVGMYRMGQELKKQSNPKEQLAAFVRVQERNARDGAIVLIVWPFVFAVAILTGLASALLVIGASFWSVIASATP